MVLEIIIEYWSFMIFYFMLSSCRLSFQKIEILVIQIVCCHSCTQNSTFFAGIFLTHLLECLGAVNVWDGLTQSWMCQLFIIFGTHLTSDCLLNAQENIMVQNHPVSIDPQTQKKPFKMSVGWRQGSKNCYLGFPPQIVWEGEHLFCQHLSYTCRTLHVFVV